MVRDSEGGSLQLPSMYPSSQLKPKTVTFSDDASVFFEGGDRFAATYPPQFGSRMVKVSNPKTFSKDSSLDNMDAFIAKKIQILGGLSSHQRFSFETSHAGTCSSDVTFYNFKS